MPESMSDHSADKLSKYAQLSKHELMMRLMELEVEFSTFHRDSKDLEDFLEAELSSTSAKLKAMDKILRKREDEAQTLRGRILSMNRELQDKIQTVSAKEQQINELSKEMVALEVLNDNVQTGLRAKSSQLDDEIERANAFIERIAVLENDLTLQASKLESSTRRNNELEKKLDAQAKQNEVLEVKIKQMEKILQLATMNRDSIRVSKYTTPPVL